MKKRIETAAPSRRFLKIVLALIVITAAAAIIMAGLMYANIRKRAELVQSLEDGRERAYEAADQFEFGSNTLTYEAKMFCETKDMDYFRAYVTKLTQTRSRDIALQGLYRMGLATRSMSRIQDAKIASDALSNRELWAMELVALSSGVSEEDFPKRISVSILTEKEKKLSADEQFRLGCEYMMGSSYFLVKSGLDRNVREFSADLMQHYGDSTLEMTRLETANALTSLIIIVALVMLMIAMLVLYSHIQKDNAEGLSAAMQKARAASAAKSDFLSNMSHDIRTPMNAIMGMTNIALQSVAAQDYRKAENDLRIVQISSRQLLSLINDVLDLSKIESGKMVLANEPYPLPDVIRDVSAVMMPLFNAKNQHYQVRIVRLEHEFLIGDPVRLRQVLLDILNNAHKYTAAGGTIDFSVEEQESPFSGRAQICFHIADNGIGIAKNKLTKIFEPFSREISTTANQVEGTGLGLTIVKSIVDARGGKIEVESERDKGSTFTVTLSLAIQEKEQALHRFQELRGQQLLIAEEAPGCGNEISAMFRQIGVLCDCAENLSSAEELAARKDKPYLAVLADCGAKPEQTIRAIRSAAPGLPVVLLVPAGSLQEFWNTARNAGADDILGRPLFCSTLFEKILELQRRAKDGSFPEQYLAGKRILIVDDVAINRMVAQMMLENAGAEVEQAESGRRALEQFVRSQPGYYDAILMDVMMPDMGGYEAAGRIRILEREDAAFIPIIAMTANAFAEDVKKSKDAGMNAHISKPVEASALRETLLAQFRRLG